MMKNILLEIEYDGTNFCGWQRQPDKRSVQGELEKALSVVCNSDIKINGTSRTDAGVHALGQRASFKGDFGIPTARIMLAANNILAGGRNLGKVGDLRILSIEEKPLDFHARFDAKGKKYIYKIINTRETDIFARNYCYQIKEPLNIEKMKKAASFIEGTHDFKCFQASGGEEKETTVRTAYSLHIEEISRKEFEKEVNIEIIGDGFLYNMVRIITGTLVEVGLGKIKPESLSVIIENKERQNAGHTAPAQGLYLAEVYYDMVECRK